jgi:hypothetical protein
MRGSVEMQLQLLRPCAVCRLSAVSDMWVSEPASINVVVYLLQNAHINELMKKHERSFAEIKNYYNDITHNNLDIIKALKEDVAEMKKREAQNEKLM